MNLIYFNATKVIQYFHYKNELLKKSFNIIGNKPEIWTYPGSGMFNLYYS